MGSVIGFRRGVLACLSAFFCMALISGSALAQNDSYPKWDLFAGYPWLHPGATVPMAANPGNLTPYKVPNMAAGSGRPHLQCNNGTAQTS